jgi:hypothetical protein
LEGLSLINQKTYPKHQTVIFNGPYLILADLMTWWKFQIGFLTGGFFGK